MKLELLCVILSVAVFSNFSTGVPVPEDKDVKKTIKQVEYKSPVKYQFDEDSYSQLIRRVRSPEREPNHNEPYFTHEEVKEDNHRWEDRRDHFGYNEPYFTHQEGPVREDHRWENREEHVVFNEDSWREWDSAGPRQGERHPSSFGRY